MLGIYTGVIVNAALVAAGSLLGTMMKTEKLRRVGDRVLQLFACFVMVLGISGAIELNHPIYTLICIVIGTTIGELTDLDAKFTSLGNFLQKKLAKPGDTGFASSFISGTLLFCIGSMTIMGGIQSGLQHEHTIYYTKGLIDMVSAATFAMSSGIGVAFSAIPLIIYQGLLVFVSSLLGDVLSGQTIAMCSQVGSLVLIPLGLNLLGLTKIKVANYLPAMFIPFIWQFISAFF